MSIIRRDKNDLFMDLVSSIRHCDLCPRMCDRKKVISSHNGNLNSKILFIAEAPGRMGAECTGVPLYGDRTGENFEMLLANIGWKREDIFITNSILCNPQDENGNNSPPSLCEIQNCSYYLEMILELVNPDVIVTIGIKALEALKNLAHHDYILKDNVAKTLKWNNRILFPLYHMSPRATIHRSLIQQRADFIQLSHIVNPLKGLKLNKDTNLRTYKNDEIVKSKIVDMIAVIMREIETITFFKLTKLLYLIDYNHLEMHGASMSGSIYLRMQEGPWIPHLKHVVQEFDNILFHTNHLGKKPALVSKKSDYNISLDTEEIRFIKQYVSKYNKFSEFEIKTAVYLTKPMKYIIRQEKNKRNMLKTPVLYKDSTVIQMDHVSE